MSALSHKSQGPGPKISFLFARSLSSSLCRNDRAQQLLGEVHVAGFISTSASGLLMTKLSGEIRICGCISCTFWLKSALVKQSSCMPCRWMFQSLSLKSLIWKLSCKLCWFFFGLWNLVIIFSFFFFSSSFLLIFSPEPWECLKTMGMRYWEVVQLRKLYQVRVCTPSFNRFDVNIVTFIFSAYLFLFDPVKWRKESPWAPSESKDWGAQ